MSLNFNPQPNDLHTTELPFFVSPIIVNHMYYFI